jgi:hypothetical protein
MPRVRALWYEWTPHSRGGERSKLASIRKPQIHCLQAESVTAGQPAIGRAGLTENHHLSADPLRADQPAIEQAQVHAAPSATEPLREAAHA